MSIHGTMVSDHAGNMADYGGANAGVVVSQPQKTIAWEVWRRRLAIIFVVVCFATTVSYIILNFRRSSEIEKGSGPTKAQLRNFKVTWDHSPFLINHYKFKSEAAWERRTKRFDDEDQGNYEQDRTWRQELKKWMSLGTGFQVLGTQRPGKVFLSVLMIIRNEEDNLAEFIQYYLMQGVERFYVYDNSAVIYNGTRADALQDDSRHRKVLEQFVQNNVVHHIPWPDSKMDSLMANTSYNPKHRKKREVYYDYSATSMQVLAYVDFNLRFSSETEWVLKIDPDEYMFANPEYVTPGASSRPLVQLAPSESPTISTMLRYYDPACDLFFSPNTIFGSNGVRLDAPAGKLLMEVYTRSEESYHNLKSLVRASKIDPGDIGDPHGVLTRPSVNTSGLIGDPPSNPNKPENITFCGAD